MLALSGPKTDTIFKIVKMYACFPFWHPTTYSILEAVNNSGCKNLLPLPCYWPDV
jgi:hypothetical protein